MLALLLHCMVTGFPVSSQAVLHDCRSQLLSPAHTQGREIGILYRRYVPFRSVCLFIQPFIYTSMDSYLFLLWVISQYYIIYFLAHLVPTLATGGHWSAPLELPPLLFLSTSFLFVTIRRNQTHLLFSLP